MSGDPHVGPQKRPKGRDILMVCVGGLFVVLLLVFYSCATAMSPVTRVTALSNSPTATLQPSSSTLSNQSDDEGVRVIATVIPTIFVRSEQREETMPNIVRQPTIALTSQGSMPDLPVDLSHGNWTIKANAQIDLDPIVKENLANLEDPNPRQWPLFPNVPNPNRPDFKSEPGKPAPWGLQYGMDESPFCENNPCDWIVPARSYKLFTGDYSFLGYECRGDGKTGCLIMIINVMDKSVTFRNQSADNGFTVMGLYWDGRVVEKGILGAVSHASANMLGLPTLAHPGEVLNAGGDSANSGANCGNSTACRGVKARVVFVAGDRILAFADSLVVP